MKSFISIIVAGVIFTSSLLFGYSTIFDSHNSITITYEDVSDSDSSNYQNTDESDDGGTRG